MSSRPCCAIPSDRTFHMLGVRHMIHNCILSSMNKYNCTAVRYYADVYSVSLGTKCLKSLPLVINTYIITHPSRLQYPPMEADAAYQGCLPSSVLYSRLLTVRLTGKVQSL